MLNKYDSNLYAFLSSLALTYRLSLDNLCIILGLEVTDENKKNIYDNLIIYSNEFNKDLKCAYDFLFSYETVNEKKSISAITRTNAKKFIEKYKNSEDKKSVYEELFKVDKEYKKLKQSYIENRRTLTLEEIEIIELHRLKYALGSNFYLDDMELGRGILYRYESNTSNIFLKDKLKALDEYLSSLYFFNKHPKL